MWADKGNKWVKGICIRFTQEQGNNFTCAYVEFFPSTQATLCGILSGLCNNCDRLYGIVPKC